MTPVVPTIVWGMAAKKTTQKKTAAKKTAEKKPVKKAAAKKTAKKAAPAKKAVKKASPKVAAEKKPSAKKAAVNANRTTNGTYTSATTANYDVVMTQESVLVAPSSTSTSTSTLVQMNDVKSSSLRKRMTAWFKRS